MDSRTKALCDFLNAAHSVYHAQAYLAETLKNAGYTRLYEQDEWALAPGGKYFLTRGGSALVAFRVPQGSPKGFLMSASHSDRPTFKVKENFELAAAYTRMAVERYGGMLIAPWLDRPLSVAGRVTVETEAGVETKLLDIDRDLLLIPNVAIHMNRQANEGYKWNPAVDTLPLVGSAGAAGKLPALLEMEAGGKILGHDLYLYIRQKASVWGVDGEYISAAALDDLECAWGCTQGFLASGDSGSLPVLCIFDNEEVGSATKQGAASTFLRDTLRRISLALGQDEEAFQTTLARSFLVSADNAHAIHPDHPEYADADNCPRMNKGVVIKFNANQHYATDGRSCAVFRAICTDAGVPVQVMANRSDLPGGSTLGCIAGTLVPVSTVDIGLAQLAMHSAWETMGTADCGYLADAMARCFETEL